MSSLNKIFRLGKLIFNEVTKPESFSKGEIFENYVRKYIFPKKDYKLIHRTHSYNDNKNDYIKSSLYPDFLFRSKKNGKEFYVEAKFRSNFYDDKVEWAKPYQLKRYREINYKKRPVFLCLGLHGEPNNPENIFIIPIKKIHYTGLFQSFLRNFEFPRKRTVSFESLWELLK